MEGYLQKYHTCFPPFQPESRPGRCTRTNKDEKQAKSSLAVEYGKGQGGQLLVRGKAREEKC